MKKITFIASLTLFVAVVLLVVVSPGSSTNANSNKPPVIALLTEPEMNLASQDEETKRFMQVKLRHSQKLIEGLTKGDFSQIEKNSQELHVLSNETTWQVYQTPEYIRMSREFADSCLRLRDAAQEENLDAATLAYFEVTLSCVRCHKYTRAQGR